MVWLETWDWSWGSSAPCGPEMGVGDMWALGLGQLDGSQCSYGLSSLGTPRVRGKWRKGRAGVLSTTSILASHCVTCLWEEEGCVVSLQTRV